MRFIVVAIIAIALVPGSASAQSAAHARALAFSSAPTPVTALQERKGPTVESAAVGVRSASLSVDRPAPRRRTTRSGIGHAGALMVVGGGAMLAGSFMDGEPGTFFLVGGALVLLYGLYQLVR